MAINSYGKVALFDIFAMFDPVNSRVRLSFSMSITPECGNTASTQALITKLCKLYHCYDAHSYARPIEY